MYSEKYIFIYFESLWEFKSKSSEYVEENQIHSKYECIESVFVAHVETY